MTPMMNMLIILISFLVTMVVFTHLAVIKFSLPPGQGNAAADTSTAPKGAEVDITVLVSEEGYRIIGEGRKLDPIPKNKGQYDLPTLGKYLQKLKEEFATAETVVLLIDTSVIYQDVISTMDQCRESKFPKILLSGGFE